MLRALVNLSTAGDRDVSTGTGPTVAVQPITEARRRCGCMGELSDVDELRAVPPAGEDPGVARSADVARSEVSVDEVRAGIVLPDRDTGFEDLYRRELVPMVQLAYLLVGREDVANDAVHDAFAKVYERWSKIDNHGGYLRTSVVNRCRDVQRRRRRDRRRARSQTLTADELPVVELGALELVDALLKLPAKQREVLVLRFYADMSEAEVADHVGIPAGTVKSHVSRGLAELRKVVER